MIRGALVLALVACAPEPGINPPADPPVVLVGEAVISPERLDLAAEAFDSPVVGAVRVENVGEHPLTLRSAVVAGGARVVTTDDATNANRRIDAGTSFDVLVVCRYREEPMVVVEATLDVQTNDPDAALVSLPVTCTPPDTDTDGDTDG